jgi:aryl-alcohol dehydrogenase-like predicted oxidoreductase
MYAWQFMKMLSTSERNGWAKFVTMQNHYNLVYREEEREMIPLCTSERIGILPWSPLARGLLAGARHSLDDRQSTPRAEHDDYAARLYDHASDWIVVEAVRFVAQERGCSMAQVALAWLLSKPAVVAPIIGATSLKHLETAIEAVNIQLTAAEIETLEVPYQPHRVKGM